MARLYGRSKRGQRCRAAVPHGHWLTTTFTAALRCTALTAPMTLDGPMNAVAFLAYIEQVLAPTLNPDDIVVMDNCRHIKAPPSGPQSRPAALAFCCCHPIRPISIRSRTPLPNSNRACAKQPPGPSMPSKAQSLTPTEHSTLTNAQTTSGPLDTVQLDRNLL